MSACSVPRSGRFLLGISLLLAAAALLILGPVATLSDRDNQNQIMADCYQLPDGKVVCD